MNEHSCVLRNVTFITKTLSFHSLTHTFVLSMLFVLSVRIIHETIVTFISADQLKDSCKVFGKT